jgi:hypothetical protein
MLTPVDHDSEMIVSYSVMKPPATESPMFVQEVELASAKQASLLSRAVCFQGRFLRAVRTQVDGARLSKRPAFQRT